jgi:hypothetical protein
VKQESCFAWCDHDPDGEYRILEFDSADSERRISAFSATELAALPHPVLGQDLTPSSTANAVARDVIMSGIVSKRPARR